MFQLPEEMAGLHLMEEVPASEPVPDVSTPRVLRKRAVENAMPAGKSSKKRRCFNVPKKETMSHIKKLYLNQYFKNPCPKKLETIFEGCEDDSEGEGAMGKHKFRRSILFRDGASTKMKNFHRKKMVKRLEASKGTSAPRKRIRVSLETVLQRLSEDQEDTESMCVEGTTNS